jgi:CheY-like chemotaxis protein
MFVQGDASLERSQGGLGLGLTLVKQLIEAHGGSVTATSQGIGRGSEFVLRLPLLDGPALRVEHSPSPDQISAPTAAASSASMLRRILVVDDNLDSAESLSIVLQLQGYEVRTVNDGPSAIELAEAWRPEIMLLDIGLPGLNGYDVARHLGSRSWSASMRLIALTGWGQASDQARSAAAGFVAHLVKPVEVKALIRMLDAAPQQNAA